MNKLFPVTYWLDGTAARFPGNVSYVLEKRQHEMNTEVAVPKPKLVKPKQETTRDTSVDEARLTELEASHQALLYQMNETNDLEELMTLQQQADALQADIDTLLNQLLESM